MCALQHRSKFAICAMCYNLSAKSLSRFAKFDFYILQTLGTDFFQNVATFWQVAYVSTFSLRCFLGFIFLLFNRYTSIEIIFCQHPFLQTCFEWGGSQSQGGSPLSYTNQWMIAVRAFLSLREFTYVFCAIVRLMAGRLLLKTGWRISARVVADVDTRDCRYWGFACLLSSQLLPTQDISEYGE